MRVAMVVVAGNSGCCDVIDKGIIIARFWSVVDANIYGMMLVEHGLAKSGFLANGTHIRP